MYLFFKEPLSFFIDEANKIDYNICSKDYFINLIAEAKRYYYNNASIDFHVGKKSEVGVSKGANATTYIHTHPTHPRITIAIYNRLSDNLKIATLLHEFSHIAGFVSNTREMNLQYEEIIAEFTTYLLCAKYEIMPDYFNKNGRTLFEYVPTLHPSTDVELELFEKAKERARFLFNDFFVNWKISEW